MFDLVALDHIERALAALRAPVPGVTQDLVTAGPEAPDQVRGGVSLPRKERAA